MFFVGYPHATKKDRFFTYAVTARHVIEEIAKRSDGNAYCRMNTVHGKVRYEPTPIAKWVFNEDSRVDVAVAQISYDTNLFEHKFLSLSMFVTREIITEEELGIGDDLFFPGLFTQHPGRDRNLPVVRIGNIAAMPEEPVETSWGVILPSYLVEARSLGGLSGSPVFWHPGIARVRSGNLDLGRRQQLLLLGLVHGHYEERGGAWDSAEAAVTDTVNPRAVNMGIAIVVPSEHVLATLDHPVLQHQREAEEMVDESRTEEYVAAETGTANPSSYSYRVDTINDLDNTPNPLGDPDALRPSD